MPTSEGWAIKWRSENALDGKREYLIGRYAITHHDELPPLPEREGYSSLVFKSRRAAAAAIKQHWGYIAKRPDLRREPHGWRVPVPVRVTVTVTICETQKST
jgi:hypothetical protein